MAPHGEFSVKRNNVYDVVVYLSSVLNINKHPKKLSCLSAFAEGVKAVGHSVHVETQYRYTPSKLAVILGWVTQDKTTPNILLRQQIVDEQSRQGNYTMCIDANCWKYIDTQNRFLRYSIGGPFYDQAEYANHNSSSEKWYKISSTLNLGLKPWRTKGQHIVVFMQRDGGFSMKNLDPMQWLGNKLIELRQHTTRPIVIRPHPGKPQDFSRFVNPYDNISVIDSQQIPLSQSLHKAWAAVFFNSSSAVASVMEGVPIFIDDKSCVAWNVANKDIKNIERPEFFERDQWLWDLSAAHWTDEEGSSGDIYRKFLPYLNT
jgi:hypothetical protein